MPEYYWPQVTWGMAVTRLPRAHGVALVYVYGDIRIYSVPFDPELFGMLLAAATEFW